MSKPENSEQKAKVNFTGDGGLSSLPIAQTGAPVLRAAALPVPVEEITSPPIQKLIDDMVVTMRTAPGVGLAAPQVGVSLQVIVVEDREEVIRTRLSEEERRQRERWGIPLQVVVNPRIRRVERPDEGGSATFYEGCLSVPGLLAMVERDREVIVDGFDREGKPITINAKGWNARIFQHEVDHLRGTLYIDRMISRTLSTMEQYEAHWRTHSIDETLKILQRSP